MLLKKSISPLLWLLLLLLSSTITHAQCPAPEFFDLDLATTSNTPVWIRCVDNVADPDDYTLELISPNNIQDYQIDWGDGSPLENGSNVTAGNPIPHNYTALGSFTVTFTETDQTSSCQTTITGNFINDRKPGATAIPPTTNTSGCTPHVLTFENTTTNVSPFTRFTWDWGDGTIENVGPASEPGTVGQPISHTYLSGTSDCGMQVTLTAISLCDTTFVTFGPYDMWDLDTAVVNASAVQLCVGDSVTFTDVSDYNCVGGARRIRWDFSDFGGPMTGWLPAVGSNRTQTYFVGGAVGSTYQVVLEDSNFCGIDVDLVNVSIIAPPTASITPSVDTICNNNQGTFNNLSSGANEYSWNFGDGGGWNTITSSGSQSNLYSSSGDYIVQLAANIGGAQLCTDTTTADLHVLANPVASFTMDQNSGCDSVSVTFTDATVGASSWDWDFGNGSIISGQGPHTTLYNGVGTYEVELTVEENVFNCISTFRDYVTIFPTPSVNAITDTVCFGDTVNFIDQSTLIDPTGTILRQKWTGISGNNLSNLTGDPDYPNNPDEFEYLTIFEGPTNDGNNYGSRIHGYVIAPESGSYFFWIASDDNSELYLSSDADPANKVLVASVSGNTNSQEWNKYASQVSLPITLVAGSRYYIEAIHKEGGGGDNLAVGWQLPSGTFERPIPGNRLTPYTDGKFINSWNWNFGDGSGMSASQNPSYVYPSSGSYYAQLEVGTNQCSAMDSFSVFVADPVSSQFVITDTSGCSPFTTQLINQSSGAVVYYWDFGDGTQDTISVGAQDTINYTWYNNTSSSRIFSIKLTAEGSSGCTDFSSKNISVLPTPVADFVYSHPNPPCAPLEVNFQNTSAAQDTNYTWYMSNLDTLYNPGLSFNYSFNNFGSSIRFDTVRLVATSQGCTDEVVKIISVFPEPNYTVETSIDTGCHPLNVDFSLVESASSYFWDFGDGTFSSSPNPNKSYSNFTNQDTVYTATVYVSSPFACQDTVETPIYVAPSIVADFTPTPTQQTLPNSTVNVINTSSGAIDDYYWDYDDGTLVNTQNPSSHIYGQADTFNIKLKVSNSFCSDSIFKAVIIHPLAPTALFTGSDTGCVPLPVSFTNNSMFATSYLWDFGDGQTSTQENPNHTYAQSGLYTVTLIAYNNSGSDTVIKVDQVLVDPSPVASFNSNPDPPTELIAPADIFFNNISVNANTYHWDFGDSTTSIATNTLHTYQNPGVYTVTLVASSGVCIDTFSLVNLVSIVEGGQFVIPNAFTPNSGGSNGGAVNSGGLNDIFFPKTKGNVLDFKMAIFNRWGELLFVSNDINIGWDGYYKGVLAKEDVYVYKVEIKYENGGSDTKIGDFTLLRDD